MSFYALMMAMTDEPVEMLKGKTLVSVLANDDSDELTFTTTDGEQFRMYHSQDCCESVRLAEVIGDLDDLVGSPILEAEEVSSEGEPAPEYADSYTWTFYKFGTIKGSVTLRWLGESNGYYSESVDFARMGEAA